MPLVAALTVLSKGTIGLNKKNENVANHSALSRADGLMFFRVNIAMAHGNVKGDVEQHKMKKTGTKK